MASKNKGDFIEVRHKTAARKKSSRNNARGSADQRSSKSCRTPASPAPAASGVRLGRSNSNNRRGSTASSAGRESGSLNTLDDPDEHSRTNTLRVDLSAEALDSGLVLEMLILEALINHPELTLFSKSAGANQLKFTHPEGDLHTWLNVTRHWVAHLQQGTVVTWYQNNHVTEVTLRHVEKHVESRRHFLCRKLGHRIRLAFGHNSQTSDEIISNIFLDRFQDNLCVYQGHPQLGYEVLATGETVFVHPSSSVRFLTKNPTFLLFADAPDTKAHQVRAVMVLSDGLVSSLLDFNSLGSDVKKAIKGNVVQPCSFENVGESVAEELEKIWNGDEITEETLKETLKFQCNDTPLLFERNVSDQTVTVHALPDYHQTVRTFIHEEVKKLQARFKTECLEIGFPNDQSHLRLLIGPGGTNEKFLFPHDFRSVWIHETREGALSRELVLEQIQKFGQVVDLKISRKTTQQESGIWGTVTFHDPDDVIKLLASSKSHDAAMLIELAPNLSSQNLEVNPVARVTVNRTVTLRVKLCRRPIKSGIAHVRVKGKRDFGILLNTKSMAIGNDRVTMSTTPGKADLIRLSGLSAVVEDAAIAEAITQKLAIIPAEVEAERAPPFTSSADDLQNFKTALRRLVDKAVDVSKVNVRVFMPSADELNLCAELRFPTRRAAISALDFLSGAHIRGIPLHISGNPLNDPQVPNVIVRISTEVYGSLKAEVKKVLGRVPPQVEVHVVSSEDHQELRIHSQNNIEAENITRQLEELLAPIDVKLTKRKMDLLMKEDETFLAAVMEETKTFIELERETRTLHIYGVKSRLPKAREAVLENIEKLMETPAETDDRKYRLPLHGEGKPASLMIEVMKDVEGLEARTGVKNLRLDLDKKLLCYSGTDEAHFGMQAVVASLCDLLLGSSPCVPGQGHPELSETCASSEPQFDCVACYCPIEGAHCTLQTCGHHYCAECIDTHLSVSLENKRFPIVCVDETCVQPICVRDLHILSRRLDRGMFKVLKTSSDHFVQTRPQHFGFCHRPDCHGVVYKHPDASAYVCPLCQVRMCPRCLNSYHGQQSCDDYINNTAFKQWMAGSQDRKKCPNCGMAIEKIDGCNRVECTNCQRHICWKCLEHYPDSRLAYDHLNRVHNGYM